GRPPALADRRGQALLFLYAGGAGRVRREPQGPDRDGRAELAGGPADALALTIASIESRSPSACRAQSLYYAFSASPGTRGRFLKVSWRNKVIAPYGCSRSRPDDCLNRQGALVLPGRPRQ